MNTKFDLGFRSLAQDWKHIFTTPHFKDDLIAGLTVACIAIPLSLAIALASGVSPATGLITAIIAGIVCAIFGGSPLAVSGPAAAMSILIASNVEQFGLGGLLIIGLTCGIFQILFGVFGLGSLMKFIPVSVIGGFTAGIGAIILIGQLPRALGLQPPDQGHIVTVITHLANFIHQTNIWALVLTVFSFLIMRILPKINSKLPAALFAIILPTIAMLFIPNSNIATIGEIPRSLPLPSFPTMPTGNLTPLFYSAISVFFLASLESLLSASAVDKMAKKGRHDPNQELIGQGLGNVVVSLFGGIPVTGVIARTAVNIKSGAQTRLASIIHSVVLIACVFVFAPLITRIPIPALAGILISVSVSMLDIKSFHSLFKVSKPDATIFFITLATILAFDLIMGVQAGLVAASFIVLFKIGKTRVFMDSHTHSLNPFRCSLEGSVTFLSSRKIEEIHEELKKVKTEQKVVIDVSRVTSMDMSGAMLIAELLYLLKAQNISVILKGLTKKHEHFILANTDDGILPCSLAVSEKDVLKLLSPGLNLQFIKEKLIHGIEKFRSDPRHDERQLFEQLITLGQNPHTLFITCSDSRISPNLITSSDPGELFVIRNVGNVIPSYQTNIPAYSEGAAIEFALRALEVKTIVICGHAACGAVKARIEYKKSGKVTQNSALHDWLNHIYIGHELHDPHICEINENDAAKENVTKQIEMIKTYPIVQEKLEKKQLAIFGWFYDIATRDIQVWSEQTQNFESVSSFIQQWRSHSAEGDPNIKLQTDPII